MELKKEVYDIEVFTSEPTDQCFKYQLSHLEEMQDKTGGNLEVNIKDDMSMTELYFYNKNGDLVDSFGVPYYKDLPPEEKEAWDSFNTDSDVIEEA